MTFSEGWQARAITWRIATTLALFALAGLASWMNRPRAWPTVITASACIWFAYWLQSNISTFTDPRHLRALRAAVKAARPKTALRYGDVLLDVSKPSWWDTTIHRITETDLADARADLLMGAQVTTVRYEVFFIRGRYTIIGLRGAHAAKAGADGELEIMPSPRMSSYRRMRAMQSAGRSGALHVTPAEIADLLHQLQQAEPM
ncbi:hypothetical protein [Streptosporangium jomthongense]|uniref:PH domain-containing protein n=1 Tax=Streptosporangium jomthongense TaxID=1193683 RepID=A0ABV8FDL1_9ACTN